MTAALSARDAAPVLGVHVITARRWANPEKPLVHAHHSRPGERTGEVTFCRRVCEAYRTWKAPLAAQRALCGLCQSPPPPRAGYGRRRTP